MKLLRGGDEQPEVQMAPLIDCVFLLLIFFLVATTLKKKEPKLPIELPESGASIEMPVASDQLIVGLDVDGQLYLNGEVAPTEIVHETLKTRAAQNPAQEVRIDADQEVRYRDLIEVIELCQFYDLRNVGLHTRAPGAPKKKSVR